MSFFPKISINWHLIARVFLISTSLILFLTVTIVLYFLGFIKGYNLGQEESQNYLVTLLDKANSPQKPILSLSPTPTQVPKTIIKSNVTWGGPQLWESVNKRRVELGVNPLSSRSELCTIASIRLNELLELGKLDNHEGFSNMSERRSDLKWIFEEYSTIAEFLALGGKTPDETVSLWENTLGHKKLLTGGEYVWGCIYAQNTFAVAITAF